MCATTTFYLSEEITTNLMAVSGEPMEVELDRIKNKILTNQITIRDIVSVPFQEEDKKQQKQKILSPSKVLAYSQKKDRKQHNLTSGATLGDILKAQGIDLMTMISDK